MKREARSALLALSLPGAAALAACSMVGAPRQLPSHPATAATPAATVAATPAATAAAAPAATRAGGAAAGGGVRPVRISSPGKPPLPVPGKLRSFPGTPAFAGTGTWHPAGRLVAGKPAVYETLLVPPGGTKRAGIAWMDTSLLAARLYSGSVSPGGSGYRYSAPVTPAAASSLVAAFNGGFKMGDAHGGYYTEHRLIRPLVTGGASLVIYADGSATVGAWGSDVRMTPAVTAVRQNLYPLVVNGEPTARASTRTWRVWGGTCPCGAGQHGSEQQWRSGLGVTADGALVYVAGPGLNPLQLAGLLAGAGAVRGMELDINPTWPVFASFRPAAPGSRAAPSNGTRLIGTYRGPATFFDPAYGRDFITLSAAPAQARRRH
ncbi:MAG TPA: hypothetical protein VGD91_14725 [Trebonia sp.]